MNPRTSPRRPPTCSALIMLQPHPSSTPRFYGAAANRGYSPLRSNEGIHEGVSHLWGVQSDMKRTRAKIVCLKVHNTLVFGRLLGRVENLFTSRTGGAA